MFESLCVDVLLTILKSSNFYKYIFNEENEENFNGYVRPNENII